MVTRQIRAVDIQERNDFDDLLRRLRTYADSTLTVDVAADVEVLSLPGEFEELYSSAHSYGVRIELETDDPVRQELARIYGMRADLESSVEVLPRAQAPESPVDIGTATQHRELEPTQEFRLDTRFDSDTREAPAGFSPFGAEASYSFVTATAYPPRRLESSRRRSTAVARPRRKLSRALGSGSIVVSAALIVGAVVVLLLALFAPSAQIVVVPEARLVNARVTYGLAGSGAGLDVAVQPVAISETLNFEATVPATGEAFVADTRAQGMLYLTNPHAEVIVLPAGTIFASASGEMSYSSLELIEIPAADPFQSARFGTAAVGVEALEAGPDGNVAVGALTGTLESGIMFQNRFPVEGGAMKRVAVVTAADLEALEDLANADLSTRIETALNSKVPEGWALIGSPNIVSAMSTSFSVTAGTVAEDVTIRAQTDLTGSIYDPVALEEQARERLLTTLTMAVPEGYGLVLDSIRTSTPQTDPALGPGVLTLSADGTVEAQLGDDFENELAGALVGKREAFAIERLQTTAGVASFDVSYGPDWLPWQPTPRLSERISITFDGS